MTKDQLRVIEKAKAGCDKMVNDSNPEELIRIGVTFRDVMHPASNRQILSEISGSLKAVLFDNEDKEIKKIPVRELTDSLKKSDNISTVVFDGIITQRLLDIANSKNIKEIVGIKIGNVVKMTTSVKVLTKKDLE